MTDPRPPRTAQPGERRSPGSGARRPPAPPPVYVIRTLPKTWIEREASRIRWITWIAVVLIFGRLVLPRPDGWHRWNDAAAALSDVEAARTGALIYYQAARQWPEPGQAGVIPAGMLPYLSGGVSFGRPRYRLRWEYASDSTSGARVIGISVSGDDPGLALTMARRAPEGMPFIVSGARFTALIASASGR